MDANELRIKIKLLKIEYAEKKQSLLPENELISGNLEERALIFANTIIDYGLEKIRTEAKVLPKSIRYPFPEKEISANVAKAVEEICRNNNLHVHWNYERGYIVFVILP